MNNSFKVKINNDEYVLNKKTKIIDLIKGDKHHYL